MNRPEKTCLVCGRSFAWRKKWARTWHEVNYCSEACRRAARTNRDQGAALEHAILDLLAQRDPDATICPSEAARRVAPDAWERLMEPARQAARRLVAAGRIQVLQRGRVVDPSRAKGPIRLRRVTVSIS